MRKVVFSFILFASLAQAQTCPDVAEIDLSQDLGPTRNQDSIGWCYAFTAADLLGQYYQQQKNKGLATPLKGDLRQKENMISPVGIALRYNEKTAPDYYESIKKYDLLKLGQYNKRKKEEYTLQGKVWKDVDVVPVGGTTEAALYLALEKGVCLEKEAPSESFTLVKGQLCAEKNICSSDLRTILRLVYDQATRMTPNCEVVKLASETFPQFSEKEMESLLRKTSRDRIFYELNSISCQHPLQLEGMTTPTIESKKGAFGEENEELIALIESALSEGKIAGIEYYSNFLRNPALSPLDLHASSIVGKRINPQTCETEYRLRNSWGQGCQDYGAFEKTYWNCLTDKQTPEQQQKVIRQLKQESQKTEALYAQLRAQPTAVQTSYFIKIKQKEIEEIEIQSADVKRQIDAYGQGTTKDKIRFFCTNKVSSLDMSYENCLKLKVFNDPDFFTRLRASYQAVLSTKELAKEELTQKMASEYFLTTELEQLRMKNENLKEQMSFYKKGAPGFLKEHFCSTKFPFKMRNPNITCDQNTGYIYVKKNDLKKVLTSATVLR